MEKEKLDLIKEKLTIFKRGPIDLNKSQKSKDLYEDIKELDKKITKLQNERYSINEEYVKSSFNDCQSNIKRCFKDNISVETEEPFVTNYYMIVKTKDIMYEMRRGNSFDENNYYVLTFKYPYDNSLAPFKNDILNVNYEFRSGRILEIDNEEFLEKLNEVNKDWINKINNKC